MFSKTPTTRAGYLNGALLINVMLIGMGVLASVTYGSYSTHLLELTEQQKPLLVVQLYQSALAFTWIPIIPILVIANSEILIAKILRKPVPLLVKRVQSASMWIVFLGTALLVFGNQLLNPLWSKTFTEAGYSRCETWILPDAKNFFNDAWVLQPDDCFDPVLKQVLDGKLGKIETDRARRYLEEKHRFLQNYNASQPTN